MQSIYLTIALAPLVGALAAGLFGRAIGRVGAHTVTIAGVGAFLRPVGLRAVPAGVRGHGPVSTGRSTPGW